MKSGSVIRFDFDFLLSIMNIPVIYFQSLLSLPVKEGLFCDEIRQLRLSICFPDNCYFTWIRFVNNLDKSDM